MKQFSFLNRIILMASVLGSLSVQAQQALTAYKPDAAQMAIVYRDADQLDTLLRKVELNNQVLPVWQADKHSFWYKRNLANKTWEYIYVNVKDGSRKKAFDAARLAAAMQKETGKPVDPGRLALTKLFFNEEADHLTLKTKEQWFKVDLSNYTTTATTDTLTDGYNANRPLQRNRSRWQGIPKVSKSPDGKKLLLLKGGNVYVKNLDTGKEQQLSTDGNKETPYGEFSWSPDSKTLVGYRIDPKKIKEVHYVLSAEEGTTRGELKSREYAQPGDDFTTYTPFAFDVVQHKQIKVDTEVIDFFGPQELNWRKGDNRFYTYEMVDRGHQRFRVIEVDVQTGKTRNIIDEKTKTFIYENRIYTRYLPETNEMIWSSEKDGYNHLYLVNTITGKQQPITKGNWVVRGVDSIDVVKREVWFRASGINAAEDPYHIHYYRTGFDGKKRVDLTPEPGNHQLSFSPDRKYYLDTYSQVNVAPVTLLKLITTGKAVTVLEEGNTKAFLETGVKLPEIFVSKARDGQTDIWGVVWQPSKMDPNKTYPVIEYIYAGPQDSFVPKSFLPYSEMQSMAELGFIVVQIDGMGTANRSKAFHDVCWQNLADAGFPDRILWMKDLAKKYPQADISRVGVYGTSAGGQNSTGALLFHPEFYKAAVSACGCHDNRIDKQWWNEQWMGYPVGPHYGEQSNITNAAKLQGNLLLIVGEADENVPPESTFRLADALIKANKDFDFLCVPGMGHSDGGPYGRRKKRDFFVKTLLNTESPKRNLENLVTN
ncbi:dipeptidyl aminopeptidase/acylaminoacyl peptidase [Pedobacter sp. CAN_A7]|uniref:S9 family peptidase n=1 Tax=Pedobacter sp. CAN_A7 TaxID=2787722 RepID=UPI001A359AB8